MEDSVAVEDVLMDLIEKYHELSKKFDEKVGKLSIAQLVKGVDALTKLARLILRYRGILDLEENERELTRILTEIREEMRSEKDSGKTALWRTKRMNEENNLIQAIHLLAERLRELRAKLIGGDEDE
ncbi:MAG TPA: hypothetical protein ENF33_05270 [Nitrososphaeria archaeon]|nr:hypothetical protein [Nitrososphaeria archaeon]